MVVLDTTIGYPGTIIDNLDTISGCPGTTIGNFRGLFGYFLVIFLTHSDFVFLNNSTMKMEGF